MEEGTVIRWLVEEGADVAMGDAVAEIETDKAAVDFESPVAGVLLKALVAEGTTVPVGETIAVVGDAGEDPMAVASDSEGEAGPPDAPDDSVAETPAAEPAAPSAPEPQQERTAMFEDNLRASPVARKLAEEQGIDLSLIKGTGPGGRITRDDVLSFAPEPDEPEPSIKEEAPTEPAAEPEAEIAEGAPVEEAAEPEAEMEQEAPAEDPAEPEAEVDEEAVAEEAAEPEAEVDEEAVAEEATEPEAEMEEEAPAEEPAEPEAEMAEEEAPAEEAAEPVAEMEEEAPAEEPAEPEPEVAAEAAGEMVPLTRMRRQIARVTVRSKQETPHYYVSAEIDMTEAMSLRQQINSSLEAEGVRITVNDLVHQGVRHRAGAPSEVQRLVLRRRDSDERQHRHRHRHRAGGWADRARRDGLRRQEPEGDLRGKQGRHQPGERRDAERRGVHGRHVLHQQHGHVRHHELRCDHPAAPVGHAGCGQRGPSGPWSATARSRSPA